MPAIRRRSKGSTFAPPALRAVTTIPPIPQAPLPREALPTLQLAVEDHEAVYLVEALLEAAERAQDEARSQQDEVKAHKYKGKAEALQSVVTRVAQAFVERRRGA